jgi:RimJ/RimL family protein N-acetyltransferase
MQNLPTLSTARLVLSLPTVSDLEGIIFHDNSTSEIAENTINFPYPYEEKHAHFWLKMAEEGFAKKDAYIFVIREKENLKLIGAIGLHLDFANRKAEIGYWLGKSFWNKGYVSEALQKIVEFGFEELHLNKIYASHFPHNPASGKVLQKNGFEFEGILKQEVLKNGQFLDLHRYAIFKKNI